MENPRDPLTQLIGQLKKLPGIGAKSAQRIAFHLVGRSSAECAELADAITDMKETLILCSNCNDISGEDTCRICTDQDRDASRICVVEEPFNVRSLEKGAHYRGTYHVLHGAISPLNGVGPDRLKIESLFQRLRAGGVEEVILATNPTADGEATAHYLSRLIKPMEITVSRIAFGIPVGSDIEYADEVTLSRAISGRHTL